MNNLVFGKYILIDSLMHRLDPRAKLIGLFLIPAGALLLVWFQRRKAAHD